jgi:hypothetical protein
MLYMSANLLPVFPPGVHIRISHDNNNFAGLWLATSLVCCMPLSGTDTTFPGFSSLVCGCRRVAVTSGDYCQPYNRGHV